MFGLNDNKQGQDPAAASRLAMTMPSVMPVPPSGPPPAPAVVTPVITPTTSAISGPPAGPPKVMTPEPVRPAPLPEPSPTPKHEGNINPGVPGGIAAVNLENAYIASTPPNVGDAGAAPVLTAASLTTNVSEDELINLKQQALRNLIPLIDELDQSPEEKFKTTMMLIQASDNADLVKDAFDAANQIADEKKRAQALLDVVNEINYFTLHHETDHPSD